MRRRGRTDDARAPRLGAASAKDAARRIVVALTDEIVGLSDDIHDHPELLFAEHHAARRGCRCSRVGGARGLGR